jgi:hypothetical protein
MLPASWIGPFDKLRAGSSARKQRGPQDDKLCRCYQASAFVFVIYRVAATIAHFVAFEVGNVIDTLVGFGFFAAGWSWAAITVLGMEAVIYMAAEAFGAVKPRAHANEDAAAKPLRAVVAVGSAIIGRDVIVAIGTLRRDSDLDAYPRLCVGGGYRKADGSNSS